MRRAISEKLHSRRGASLLLALLFLLVCLTVGAVVLTAAATTAGRIERNRREQQDYLAVASAANLVKADITAPTQLTFTGSWRRIETTVTTTYEETDPVTGEVVRTWTEVAPPIIEYKPGASDEDDGTDLNGGSKLVKDDTGLLDEAFYATVPQLGMSPPAEHLTEDLAFSPPPGAETETFPTVKGELTILTDDDAETSRPVFSMSVKLWAVKDGQPSNYTTLLLAPSVSAPSVSVSTKTWDEANSHYEEITYTYTTTVTWEAPVFYKGDHLTMLSGAHAPESGSEVTP